ncbi:MAG: hypothetical protein U1F49_03980 [Rubrivivax sp.]
MKFTSNAEGSALVKFELPKTIAAGDGLLTILVEDGGVTESVSKAIPILQKKLVLGFFPEGGRMVAGLPTRLYFEATTPGRLLGKPADVEGRIVDDLGNTVATFGSHKNGLGRFDFTPATGRSYRAEVMRPAGVDERYALPLAEASGCVLRSYDDLDGYVPHGVARGRALQREADGERDAASGRVGRGDGRSRARCTGVVHLGESGSSSAAMQRARGAGVVDMTRAAGVARVTPSTSTSTRWPSGWCSATAARGCR